MTSAVSDIGLRPEWVATAREILAAEGIPHVCLISLKGSRLFGIAEADADVDLRVVYQWSTLEALSIKRPQHTVERSLNQSYEYEDCHDGPEVEKVDFVAYEAERFFGHLLNGNGNMVESLLVPDGYYWADEHGEALRRHAPKLITKQLYNFFRGYAKSQFKRASQQINTGKGVIYTFREMFMGLRLLAGHPIEFHWPTLWKLTEGQLGWESDVLKVVRRDRKQLSDELLRQMRAEFEYLDGRLDEVFASCTLPARVEYEPLNKMLLRWRSSGWVK